MGEALTRMSTSTSQEIESQALQLVKNLIAPMTRISRAGVDDACDGAKAREKLHAMALKIGHPTGSMITPLAIDRGNRRRIKVAWCSRNRQLRCVDGPVDCTEWHDAGWPAWQFHLDETCRHPPLLDPTPRQRTKIYRYHRARDQPRLRRPGGTMRAVMENWFAPEDLKAFQTGPAIAGQYDQYQPPPGCISTAS